MPHLLIQVLTYMLKYMSKLLANSLAYLWNNHSLHIKTKLRRNEAMFKKLFGPGRFIIATTVGVPVQIGFMLAAVIGEDNFAAAWGIIATLAISLWCEDVTADRNTRRKNKTYVIAVLTSVFLTAIFTPVQAISPALMIEMIIEFAFMAGMLTDIKLLP